MSKAWCPLYVDKTVDGRHSHKKKKEDEEKTKKKGSAHPLTAAHFLETERVEKLVHRKL